MRRVVGVAVAAIVAVAWGGSTGIARADGPVSLSPDTVIAGRQASFDLMQGVAGAMKAAVDAGQPVKPLTAGAKAMAAWAAVIPSQFPPGTQTGHDTRAKPEIWSDPAGFAKAASASQAAAEKLATLPDADAQAGFAAQFNAWGKPCAACHGGYPVRRD